LVGKAVADEINTIGKQSCDSLHKDLRTPKLLVCPITEKWSCRNGDGEPTLMKSMNINSI
jgi:hypothetical protein